jgi:hypothetical protein
VNPFDDEYRRLFYALVFTIHECGFRARCALEAEDSGEERIRKIKRIIRECRYGIHDISRVELDALNQMPRFNMPLELGLFLGAQEYGSGEQARKRSLVLDTEREGTHPWARHDPRPVRLLPYGTRGRHPQAAHPRFRAAVRGVSCARGGVACEKPASRQLTLEPGELSSLET